MRMIEWAFEQDIPHASKLVLVYLAANASAEGVGLMNRKDLMRATGYKTRSIQRLLKDLRGAGYLEIVGPWYLCGDMDATKLADVDLDQLPDNMHVRPELIHTDDTGDRTAPFIPDTIAQIVGDYVIDHLNNFEARIMQHIDRMAAFHVEPETEPEPEPEPPDPVIENPLYQQLLESNLTPARAYALSAADLEMGDHGNTGRMPDFQPMFFAETQGVDAGSDELEQKTEPSAPGAEQLLDGEYKDNAAGRFERILDILHGAAAVEFDTARLRNHWVELEEQENKHTVKGEPAAFELLYPAIIESAKANVGILQISDFLNLQHIKDGNAPWDREINPIDKDDPAMFSEISVMLSELEQANDPRCEVQPRTKETGDDGLEHQETVLGYHRRVKAKHREMIKLQQMGVI